MLAGERTDIPTLEWLHSKIQEHILINDNYW